ncbi:hypothetical protein BO86DRAFT_391681 [Aspergillus japonicus CBS 114.51]|uniref:Uncharacterized protein n=2 Tax=Aspergillus TaxID=5052 RepID=A0A2V5GWK2_ASPV1|nr:hypothetical protein BO86DRAFT_391681 [Aspergillus japonicus CBS 114.51]PYI15698.1 hypothetical protein BO99DRAFT_405639 [Aspergillus violaceofuscus CBS 115571]RAH78565.1 hypothetical protein BO86DRAFT_391681 [Aspergillus japonicus CBS 114.51]
MDHNITATKSGAGGNKLDQSPTPTLADYQAQWAKIHNDTIRQIKQAQEEERNARATNRAHSSPSK